MWTRNNGAIVQGPTRGQLIMQDRSARRASRLSLGRACCSQGRQADGQATGAGVLAESTAACREGAGVTIAEVQFANGLLLRTTQRQPRSPSSRATRQMAAPLRCSAHSPSRPNCCSSRRGTERWSWRATRRAPRPVRRGQWLALRPRAPALFGRGWQMRASGSWRTSMRTIMGLRTRSSPSCRPAPTSCSGSSSITATKKVAVKALQPRPLRSLQVAHKDVRALPVVRETLRRQ
ncbi:hypothetical protein T492DRAFT_1142346 [Pavlovales sp. CCMP2436]|nr:hypothetical protein T492DRAFT_1142346 [Pavlovales sp. CCMP2436]